LRSARAPESLEAGARQARSPAYLPTLGASVFSASARWARFNAIFRAALKDECTIGTVRPECAACRTDEAARGFIVMTHAGPAHCNRSVSIEGPPGRATARG
jgi:hypothetical protein